MTNSHLHMSLLVLLRCPVSSFLAQWYPLVSQEGVELPSGCLTRGPDSSVVILDRRQINRGGTKKENAKKFYAWHNL